MAKKKLNNLMQAMMKSNMGNKGTIPNDKMMNDSKKTSKKNIKKSNKKGK